MSFSRAVQSSVGCMACRAPIASSSRRCMSNVSPILASGTPTTPFRRTISSTARRRADDLSPETKSPDSAVQNATTSASLPPTPPHTALPWYLQNRPSPTPQQSAPLPDLPPNPPPLLASLLDYLANTAGMDNLTLLDLRHLDPPPALGNNLLMLLCTARSEKHLHVSADRFCRHLRRTHGLRADAAGLLGRNELKIKLRRKAKRMKMLANVGAAAEEMGNIDDGIRTGWICCTVGRIEAHPEDRAGTVGEAEFVGFREVRPGVNVVVQMFTEEKRAEIDLETLWSGVLRTHERKDRNADEVLGLLEEDVDDVVEEGEPHAQAPQIAQRTTEPPPAASIPPQSFIRPRSTTGDVFPPATNSSTSKRIRRFHTLGLRS